jgi:hypothetical protein
MLVELFRVLMINKSTIQKNSGSEKKKKKNQIAATPGRNSEKLAENTKETKPGTSQAHSGNAT